MIKIKKHKWATDYVSHKGNDFSIAEIVKHAKNIPITTCPIDAMDMSWNITGTCDIIEFSEHLNRVMNANMKHPIILAPNGGLLDGRHRLARAVYLKHKTIKVKRLKSMPPYWRKSED